METGIYLRVSTEEQAQEGFSIRGQEQKLKEYSHIKDWSVYKIYADEGISGKNITERPAMNELIADVKAGNVQNVLVFKIEFHADSLVTQSQYMALCKVAVRMALYILLLQKIYKIFLFYRSNYVEKPSGFWYNIKWYVVKLQYGR